MTTYLKEDFLYDADLLLEDSLNSSAASSPIVASQVGKVLDVAKQVDLGDGLVTGNMIVDVSDIEVGTDENYEIKLQGTNTTGFGSDFVTLSMVELGHADTVVGTAAIGADGDRYVVPFRNEQAGTVMRYVRAYLLILNGTAETITTKIWLTIKRQN
jgi:hypothetical protein